jgi:hypothetical protein
VSLDFDFAHKLRFLDKSQIQLILHSSQSILSFQTADWDAVHIPATGDISLFAMTDSGRVASCPVGLQRAGPGVRPTQAVRCLGLRPNGGVGAVGGVRGEGGGTRERVEWRRCARWRSLKLPGGW